MDFYWKIASGDVYSTADTGFVTDAPVEEIQLLYMDGQEGAKVLADKAFLRQTVLFYNLPLGDVIKTKLDKIQDIQEEYTPLLTTLQEAYASAQILGNGEAEAIQQEYKQLLQEMQEKIQAVPND